MTAETERSQPQLAQTGTRALGHTKLAAQIAARIEADIVAAGWPVGEVFGSVTDLHKRYGASRGVLREAIRLVEHHDVAVMRRGPLGGLVIRAPDVRVLTTAVVIYLEYVGSTVKDLLDVRMLLEPLAARLAAQRLTEDNIATLREALTREHSRGALAPAGRDVLHTALGRLSANAALWVFINVLVQLTARYAETPGLRTDEAESLSRASDHAHAAIADAIIAGDGALAEARTIRHLEAMGDWLLSTSQRRINRSGVDGDGASAPSDAKLAETVARRIMSSIARAGLQVGELYGCEPELLARLDVSRAVFREAVRLLEYHSVVQTRRGPGGGLIVAEPDPTASVHAMAILLDHEKIRLDDLREVRDVIELGALELATTRRPHSELVQRLNAAHLVRPDMSNEQVNAFSHVFHTEIADLSGNPILGLFLRIITTVSARHTAQPARPDDGNRPAEAVSLAHQRILDAILAGDKALARHRMRRHLESILAWWD